MFTNIDMRKVAMCASVTTALYVLKCVTRPAYIIRQMDRGYAQSTVVRGGPS